MDELRKVCQLRTEAFLNAWSTDDFVPMTYTEPPGADGIVVYHHPKGGEMHRGEVHELPGFSMEDAVVVTHEHPDKWFSPALWVRNDYPYYLRAFRKFLRRYHNCDETTPLSTVGYDVDHLRSKKQTPAGTFIRVEAVPSASNQAWGARYESLAARGSRTRPRGTADWMTVAKVGNVEPPTDWSDLEGIKRILDFKKAHSIDGDEGLAEHLITDEFMRTYLPRKKGRAELDEARLDLGKNPKTPHILPWRD